MESIFSALNLAVILMTLAFVIGNTNIFVVNDFKFDQKSITIMAINENTECGFFCRLDEITKGNIGGSLIIKKTNAATH